MENSAKGADREWFWRVVAGLLLVAIGWLGWVAYQLQPRRGLVVEGALVLPAAPQPAEQPTSQPAAAVDEPKPEPEPFETLKLARAIETPIVERKAAAPGATKRAPAPAGPKVAETPVNEAEAHFRRAAALLNQSRASEAEVHLTLALKADAAHAPARQAYVALLLEQSRVGQARDMLKAGIAAVPAHAPFSLTLARMHVQQREHAEALKVINGAGAAAQSAEFQGLRAVVLQRMGRHAEAVAAYQEALRGAPQNGATWMGLANSLEALGHRPEAAQAYRQAINSGALPTDIRDYAQARIRALD